MRIVFFTHPPFLGSQSMPRFAVMLTQGMKERGHEVEVWTPHPFFFKLPLPSNLKKWMGYIDQYLLFPIQVRKRLYLYPSNTLFVFTDHALGPWVPLVVNRPHVIHCHDFLAQRSALGQIIENPVSSTGKKYQKYIRKGYKKGKNFISVSERTRQDLHEFLEFTPPISEMVYNGINTFFNTAINKQDAQNFIKKNINIDVMGGYILHVGGNQWYKNRPGVIAIYEAWRNVSKVMLPLIMIGAAPDDKLKRHHSESAYKKDIHLLSGKSDEFVRQSYNGATVLLFPSLAEGFGWPVAEAMACGCLAITTKEVPMTEVGGKAAFYIPRMPHNQESRNAWANEAALILNEVIEFSDNKRKQVVNAGYENIKRFSTVHTLDKLEEIYQRILFSHRG